MSVILLLVAAASAGPFTFSFVGQPECVELTYADGRTQLVNTCPDPLLLDQSVQLPVEGQRDGVVPARTATVVRDLSAFTLGMNGELYRVVAVVVPVEATPEPAAPAGAIANAE